MTPAGEQSDDMERRAAEHGWLVNPQYDEQLGEAIPEMRGNPLIEALPPLLEVGDIQEQMVRPVYDDAFRQLPSAIKVLKLKVTLRQFFQPLPIHLTIEQGIALQLREGYMDRNPARERYWREVEGRLATFTAAAHMARPGPLPDGQPATLQLIMGDSGNGKSRGLRRILGLTPQVIIHNKYHGRDLPLQQVIWVIVESPRNGSLATLIYSILEQIDGLLGTQYEVESRRKRLNIDLLSGELARACENHHVGIIAIDETQRFLLARRHNQEGDKEFLNFVVRLTNILKVPIVLIGTPAMEGMLNTMFSMARRGSEIGDIIWPRMAPNSGEWRLFFDQLWQYQFTREGYELDDALRTVFYDCSQGIAGMAIALYFCTQRYLINQEWMPADERERLSPALVEQVFARDFTRAQAGILALKSGDKDKIAAFEDLMPLPDWYAEDGAIAEEGESSAAHGDASTSAPAGEAGAAGPTTAPAKARTGGRGRAKRRTAEERHDFGDFERAGLIGSATDLLETSQHPETEEGQ